MKVAFQGVRGAYSEDALLRHFPKNAVPVGFALSEQVFDAVESGQVDCGFVPVENSIAGPVGINMDLLLERKVFAYAESYLLIEHCLLANPGNKIADIKNVCSHPIALAQCRTFLDSHGLRSIVEYDTAGAAEIVSRQKPLGVAAIASKRCAEVYGLEVLAEGIQSVKNNYTRFLSFQREEVALPGLKMDKTSIAFSVHDRPGALLDCLKLFAGHTINLTKLESRPIPSNPFEYSFFADFLGGIDEPAVKVALADLRQTARRFKVLGSYPRAERPVSK
jgi:prephenate dehydratase